MISILEYTPIAQFAIGADHRITHWNRACELLTGLSASHMTGTDRQWTPFYPANRPFKDLFDITDASDLTGRPAMDFIARPDRSRMKEIIRNFRHEHQAEESASAFEELSAQAQQMEGSVTDLVRVIGGKHGKGAAASGRSHTVGRLGHDAPTYVEEKRALPAPGHAEDRF